MSTDHAFKTLVQEYHQMVFGYLLALVNEASLAEDLTQEAFVVAHHRMGEYDATRDFGAWILGIAGRLALAESPRSKRSRFVALEGVEVMLSKEFQGSSPDSAPILWERRLEALRDCLRRADETLRDILGLHYSEQWESGAVAEHLGVGAVAVWKRLSRGRHVLRNCVEHTLSEEDA